MSDQLLSLVADMRQQATFLDDRGECVAGSFMTFSADRLENIITDKENMK